MTALYGTVFLITGAALLTIGYLFVRSDLVGRPTLRRELLKRYGMHPERSYEFGFPPGSAAAALIHSAEHQIINSALHRLLLEYAIGLFLMTGISVVTGWLLAGRALAPLRRITATARRVSGENLGERIALQGPADELRELADTFDRMLGRLDGAFASQRHFVANASHELRTPLAIMRTEVDVALADPGASVGDLRQMGEAVRETIDRCEALIASLLLLARSEATTRHSEPVDLAVLAGDCITDGRRMARDAGIDVRDQLQPAWCSGDPGLLERLIANLVDNAIHHNLPGGSLWIQTRTVADRVVLTVANSGPVLDPERVDELVEPFRRLDRSVRGFGLGLSIVSSIVHAHGGEIALRARSEGGLEVQVKLPSIAPPPAAREGSTDHGRAWRGRAAGALTES